MRIYDTSTNTAIENMKQSSPAAESKSMLELPTECQAEFIKAMKIGYYKEFYKQGLITAEQLEQLIAMQDKITLEAAA